jgi:hypothetical protein
MTTSWCYSQVSVPETTCADEDLIDTLPQAARDCPDLEFYGQDPPYVQRIYRYSTQTRWRPWVTISPTFCAPLVNVPCPVDQSLDVAQSVETQVCWQSSRSASVTVLLQAMQALGVSVEADITEQRSGCETKTESQTLRASSTACFTRYVRTGEVERKVTVYDANMIPRGFRCVSTGAHFTAICEAPILGSSQATVKETSSAGLQIAPLECSGEDPTQPDPYGGKRSTRCCQNLEPCVQTDFNPATSLPEPCCYCSLPH